MESPSRNPKQLPKWWMRVLWRRSKGMFAELDSIQCQWRSTLGHWGGVAPFTGDSGPHRGKRTVWVAVLAFVPRCILGALVASRWNPIIREFYKRLCQESFFLSVANWLMGRTSVVVVAGVIAHT